MQRSKLTKLAVDRLIPGDKDRYLWDALLPGFGLKVTPRGARVYLVQYRHSDTRQTRRFTIGRHGAPWTAENARAEAALILARVKLGEDPVGQRKQARAKAARAAEERFGQLRKLFIETYAKPKNKRWDEAERILKGTELKSWEDRPVSDIAKRDIRDVVDKATARAPGAGRLLFAHLRRFFGWCVDRMYLEASPCVGLKGPSPAKARDRWLSDHEVALIWRALDRLDGPFAPVFRLLLLTAQRREEVAAMRWAELDLEAGVWTIPPERTKNAKAHEVDLAPEAVTILAALSRSGDLVFTTTGKTPLSGHSRAKARLDVEVECLRRELLDDTGRAGALAEPLARWRMHDLRRTAASGMAALGHPPHVIEAVLNHVSGARGGLVGVYQRYQHRPERRAALFAWAGQVTALVRAADKTRSTGI